MPLQIGDPRSLARAATLIENRSPEAQALLAGLFPSTGRALTAGITGAPGAGKSTLVNAMVRELRREGRTVGVIAVDPSSPWTGGAILGDRVRMQDHYADPGVFIRSMAARGHLGGVAPATLDLVLLLDAAGFDTILVETVGVGQAEIEIARLAGVTAVVLVPGMGDDVQTLKAGIMEIADVFVINKADHPGAGKLETEIRSAQALAPQREEGWSPRIIQTVATEGKGVREAIEALREAHARLNHRPRQAEAWRARLVELVRERLLERLPPEALEHAAREVAERRADPYTAADKLLKEIL